MLWHTAMWKALLSPLCRSHLSGCSYGSRSFNNAWFTQKRLIEGLFLTHQQRAQRLLSLWLWVLRGYILDDADKVNLSLLLVSSMILFLHVSIYCPTDRWLSLVVECLGHISYFKSLVDQKSCSGLQTAFIWLLHTINNKGAFVNHYHDSFFLLLFSFGVKYAIFSEMHENRTYCGTGLQAGYFHKWLYGNTKTHFSIFMTILLLILGRNMPFLRCTTEW